MNTSFSQPSPIPSNPEGEKNEGAILFFYSPVLFSGLESHDLHGKARL